MKHAWTVLAASLLLVFALAACGGGDSNTGTDQNNDMNQDMNGSENDAVNDGQPGVNGSHDPAGPPNDTGRDDSLIDDAKDALDDAGDALMGGNPTKQRHTGSLIRGASFEQMMRNGRVHDRDGFLNDFENSVTPGVMF